jgi:Uma2 family endonuclease
MAEPAYSLALPETEDGRPWPTQGQWTYEDYLRLPDDRNRYEVIRGHLYVSPAPNYDHQFTVMQLSLLLGTFIRENELGVLLGAPFDVKLPRGIANPVEPDLLFIRSENQPRSGDKFFAGTPDLVVEVLSPATRRIDQTLKLEAYRDAGVPEYWLVDPQARTILVYSLDGNDRRYTESGCGVLGQTVFSNVLSGLEVAVSEVFPKQK